MRSGAGRALLQGARLCLRVRSEPTLVAGPFGRSAVACPKGTAARISSVRHRLSGILAETLRMPEDRLAVGSCSASLDAAGPRRIELHVLPEPLLGFHEAPVLMLMANPGSAPADPRLADSGQPAGPW
jgi:hypothetical protein